MNRSLAAILLLVTLTLRAAAAILHPAGILCIPQAEACHFGVSADGHEVCCPREGAPVAITCATPCHDDCNGCLDVDLPSDPMWAAGSVETPRLLHADPLPPHVWPPALPHAASQAARRPVDRPGHLGCPHAPIVRATRLLI